MDLLLAAISNKDHLRVQTILKYQNPNLESEDKPFILAIGLSNPTILNHLIVYETQKGHPIENRWNRLTKSKYLTGYEDYSLLGMASKLGNPEIVTILLQSGANPNFIDSNGYTSLYYAVKENHISVAKILLDFDANPNICSTLNILSLACFNQSVELITLLIEHGANIDNIWYLGMNSLHWTILRNHYDIVKLLLQHKANIDIPDRQGDTPLHYAISKGNLDIIKLLLESGALVNIKNNGGKLAKELTTNAELIALIESYEPLIKCAYKR